MKNCIKRLEFVPAEEANSVFGKKDLKPLDKIVLFNLMDQMNDEISNGSAHNLEEDIKIDVSELCGSLAAQASDISESLLHLTKRGYLDKISEDRYSIIWATISK